MSKPPEPPEAPPPESFHDVRERLKVVVPALRQRTARAKRVLTGEDTHRFARAMFTSEGDLTSFLPPEELVPSSKR